MNDIKTGGPAFPLHNHGVQTLGMHISGMTLRDYFAAKAMTQFIHEVFSGNLADHGYDSVAGHAYRMADAMIKARNE